MRTHDGPGDTECKGAVCVRGVGICFFSMWFSVFCRWKVHAGLLLRLLQARADGTCECARRGHRQELSAHDDMMIDCESEKKWILCNLLFDGLCCVREEGAEPFETARITQLPLRDAGAQVRRRRPVRSAFVSKRRGKRAGFACGDRRWHQGAGESRMMRFLRVSRMERIAYQIPHSHQTCPGG